MILPKRLDPALSNLYVAYQQGTLHPEDACRCAVGNILNGSDSWKHLSDQHGSLKLNYVGSVHELLGRRFEGYLPSELLQIERAFLKGCGYQVPLFHQTKKVFNPEDRELLFNGLSEAIGVLCRLDGIPHVMELTAPFKKIITAPVALSQA